MIGMTLCSGIGAPEMAAPWVDWRFASEIEPIPREVLQQRFDYKLPADQNQGESLLWGDMTEVTPDLLRDRGIPLPELLVAGTPCQAFSIAGLRKGVEDERGNLTLKFVEICHAIVDARTDGKLVVLWENVPGVLSDKGNAFGNFLGGLVGSDDALCHPSGESWPSEGMVEGPRARLAWRVLDAQYFGLAQRRKRVFVVIDFGNAIDPAKVLFERQGLQGNTPPSRETGEEAAGGTGSGASHWSGGPHPSLSQNGVGSPGQSNQEIFSQQGSGLVAGPLTAGMHKGPRGTEAAEGNHIVPASWPAQIAPTLNAAFGDKQGLQDQHALNGAGLFVQVAFKPSHFTRGKDGAPSEIMPPLTADADKGDQDPDQLGELRVGDVANTASGRNTAMTQYGPTVRRLMPLECARLQGFPDDHCAITYRGKPASDGPQYKAYGNSMAVKNIKWIMDRIREHSNG